MNQKEKRGARLTWPTLLTHCVGLLLLTGCASPKFQVLRTASETTRQLGDSWLKTYKVKPRLHQVLLRAHNGSQTVLPADSVWGFRTEKGEVYRLYESSLYQVVQQSDCQVYLHQEWSSDSSHDFYYFSLTPNGPLYELDRKTCRWVFRQDECMLNLLSQMRTSQLLQIDSHGTFGLTNAYQYCHQQRQAVRSANRNPK